MSQIMLRRAPHEICSKERVLICRCTSGITSQRSLARMTWNSGPRWNDGKGGERRKTEHDRGQKWKMGCETRKRQRERKMESRHRRLRTCFPPGAHVWWLQLLNGGSPQRNPSAVETQGILIIAQRAQMEQGLWINHRGSSKATGLCDGSGLTVGRGRPGVFSGPVPG